MNQSADKVAAYKEKLKIKLMLKEQRTEAYQYETLKKVVDKRVNDIKKNKKKTEEMRDHTEVQKEQISLKEEQKKLKLMELKKEDEMRRQELEKKL